jgi:predicted ABC-type ATPase
VLRFFHLNGPPGIGKSTVAAVFAAEHPGVLNLDIDQVVALIGGWQDNFWDGLKAEGCWPPRWR